MTKTVFNPLSGSYHVKDHEHLGSYTDRDAARDVYRKYKSDSKGKKEHEQSYWDKK